MHRDLGGPAALARLRQRLAQRGLQLMLDFVPNHMAPDHPWVNEHPDYFVQGTEADLARAPQNYYRVQAKSGPTWSWPTAATPTSPAGLTPCSSTTATRGSRRP